MPRSDRSLAAPEREACCARFTALVLALVGFAAFQSLLHNDFIKFDDRQYVTENPHVMSGLTWQNVRWAFQTGYASNWHPMTWISHMLDIRFFGLRAGGHHLTSLVLHLFNTILLLFVLRRMTGALWRSAVVAALFAVHPLHVESVAWIAERKDVLSTFFFLLTLGFYAIYVEAKVESQTRTLEKAEPGPNGANHGMRAKGTGRSARQLAWYGLALAAFVLGLMCKPMLVTVPFLLLLLDWWPLGRLDFSGGRHSSVALLLCEKIPFLLLTVCSSAVTFLAQAGSHSIIAGLPLSLRLTNAIVSYVKYLGKTFWPSNLAIFYPHPNARYHLPATAGYPSSEQWQPGWVLLAALLLVGISFLALYRSRREPWLVTGWFWFVGTLVPVIGLVQIGMQGMADRYTYIPLIGLFIGLVWETVEIVQPQRFGKVILGTSAAVAVLSCAAATHRQVGFWRDNFTLFNHALKVTDHNAVALCNVGEELAQRGKIELAQEDFRAAEKADPRFALAYVDLGISFELQGKPEQAIEPYETAVRLRPWNESARLRLAGILKNLGRRDEALAQYGAALELNPGQPHIHYELGSLLAAQHKIAEAVSHLKEAVRLKPDYPEALTQLGTLLAGQGQFTQALAPLRQAVALSPTNALLHLDLGKALMLAGKSSEAAPEFAEAVRLDPRLPSQYLEEAKLLSSRGQLNAALVGFNTALWLKPDSVNALNGMGWILATHPLAQFRNGPQALRLAQRALKLSDGSQASIWATLDAAYAENGRFSEAIAAAEKSRELALSSGNTAAAQACDARLALYRNQRSYHQ